MFRNRYKLLKCLYRTSRSVHGSPDFAKNNYNVTRGNYKSLEEAHVKFFNQLLGEQRVTTDLSELERYNVDWLCNIRGNSSIVLKPKTTTEVSKILSFCNQNRLAVCPQGGNTSMSGASVPIFDEIVINTDLMNKIISLDDTSGVLVCEAGCILENINAYLAEKNLLMPVELGSKGSCQIGGVVSTNAGGQRYIRYGNLHGNVLGIEVVKANGEVLNFLSTLKKDNTGYHLKHLFIGAEGTLGFITKVSVQCPPMPTTVCVALLGLESYDGTLKTFKRAKHTLGNELSAAEIIDSESMKVASERLNLHSPIGDYPFYLLLETMSYNEGCLANFNKFLELMLTKRYTLNGTVALEPSKCQAIWKIRESLIEAIKLGGRVYTYDFCLPLDHYYSLVLETRKYLKSHRVYGFGHIGDGNLHLCIETTEGNDSPEEAIETYLIKRVQELNGSISAEHGIGFLKRSQLKMVKDESCIQFMKNIKVMMDPNGILNPYKVIP